MAKRRDRQSTPTEQQLDVNNVEEVVTAEESVVSEEEVAPVIEESVEDISTDVSPENLFSKPEPIEEPVITVEEPIEEVEIKHEVVVEEKVEKQPETLLDIDPATIEIDPNEKPCGQQEIVNAGQKLHSICNKLKEEIYMNNKRELIPFYYGFYSVNHPYKKGELMDVLKEHGETRKCPCRSIAISLENIKKMCDLGYIFVNLDPDVNQGKTIHKRNFPKYLKLVSNLLKNGFIKEQ